MVYASFAAYTEDAEWLVTRPAGAAFDYVEGFAFVNSDDPVNGWPLVPFPGGAGFDPALLPAGAGPVLYCLEVALYQQPSDEDDDNGKVCPVLARCGGTTFSAGDVPVLSSCTCISPAGFGDPRGGSGGPSAAHARTA